MHDQAKQQEKRLSVASCAAKEKLRVHKLSGHLMLFKRSGGAPNKYLYGL